MAEWEELCDTIQEYVDQSHIKQIFEIPQIKSLYIKIEQMLRENPELNINDALNYVAGEGSVVRRSENESADFKDALYLTNEDEDYLYANASMDDVCPYGSGKAQFCRTETCTAPPAACNPPPHAAQISTIDLSHLQIQSSEGSTSSRRPRRRRAAHTPVMGHVPLPLSPETSCELGLAAQDGSNLRVSQELHQYGTEFPKDGGLFQSHSPSPLGFTSETDPSYYDLSVDTECSFEDQVSISSRCSSGQRDVWSPQRSLSPVTSEPSMSSSHVDDLTFYSGDSSSCVPSPGLGYGVDSPTGAGAAAKPLPGRIKKGTTKPKQRTPRMSLTGLTEEQKKLRIRDQNNKASRDYRERRKERESFLATTVNSLESEKSLKEYTMRKLELKIKILRACLERQR